MNKTVVYNWLLSFFSQPLVVTWAIHLFKIFTTYNFFTFLFYGVRTNDSEAVWTMQKCVHLRECLLDCRGWSVSPQNYLGLSVSWDVTLHNMTGVHCVSKIFYFFFYFLFKASEIMWGLCFSPTAECFYNTRQRMCLTNSRTG